MLTEEKKVKKYLEDNFQNRNDLVTQTETDSSEVKQLYEGVGPRGKEGKSYKIITENSPNL